MQSRRITFFTQEEFPADHRDLPGKAHKQTHGRNSLKQHLFGGFVQPFHILIRRVPVGGEDIRVGGQFGGRPDLYDPQAFRRTSFRRPAV